MKRWLTQVAYTAHRSAKVLEYLMCPTCLASHLYASLIVSFADKTHNAAAIVADLAVHGDSVWERFTGARDGTLWYSEALAAAFKARVPGPASDRFSRLVAEMVRNA